MKRRYFGTDGVRGPYGGPVVNESFARQIGAAAGRWLKDLKWSTPPFARNAESDRLHVLIGRDSRASGASLEAALAAGLMSQGWAPLSLGVVPTPAVSLAVRRRRAAFGAVITASHNPAPDNGIKFFGQNGGKLADEDEFQIEQRLAGSTASMEAFEKLPVRKLEGAAADYIDTVRRLLPFGSLAGWRVVVDTAHGATCRTSPEVLRILGAEIIGLGDAPDGRNINAGTGSEHPGPMCAKAPATGARIGIAHDGDGDRCVLCDEHGALLDGDEILTLLAVHSLRRGALAKDTLVVTMQSNLGVDAAVQAAGGRVVRTPVGDRYVIERMRTEGATLGGESSGHIICAETGPTADGLVAALKVIEVMLDTGKPLSELRGLLKKFPQFTAALTVKEKKPLETLPALQAAIRSIESELGSKGRVMVRYSGTEPKIRLLVEGEDAEKVQAGLDRLQAAAAKDLEIEPAMTR